MFVLVSGMALGVNCGGGVQCNCGDTLTSSHTMWYSLNNCLGNGLIIGSDSITLDCNNHVIDGDLSGTDYGIDLNGRTGVTVGNCYVKEFHRGINLQSFHSIGGIHES